MEKDESLRYSFHEAAFPSVQHQASIDLAWQVQMQKATDALVYNVRGQYKTSRIILRNVWWKNLTRLAMALELLCDYVRLPTVLAVGILSPRKLRYNTFL